MRNLNASRILFLTLVSVISVSANENDSNFAPPLTHQKKVYLNENHEVFLPGSDTPLYIRLATSPDDNAQTYLLFNEATAKARESRGQIVEPQPFFMEGNGRHSVIHPTNEFWANKNNPSNVIIAQDRIFYVFVDEDQPITQKNVTSTSQITLGGLKIFGDSVDITIESSDQASGVENIYYSLNGTEFKTFEKMLKVGTEGVYNLRYYAVDHVGNIEKITEFPFALDLTPPITEYLVKNVHKGDILSPEAAFELQSHDNHAGISNIYYEIDGKWKVNYTGKPILLADLHDGEHSLFYFAEDKVANIESKNSYNFYLDKIPPKVEAEIVGDQHKSATGFYISKRSKINLTATDNRSEVNVIKYEVDAAPAENYETSFLLPETAGQHVIHYFAVDGVDNVSSKKSLSLNLDLTTPTSNCNFSGSKAKVQDTLYISNHTQIIFEADDAQAGVSTIQYILDDQNIAAYSGAIQVADHGAHKITYYATDYVNNREEKNHVQFFVDTNPPQIYLHFSIATSIKTTASSAQEEINVYPKNTMLYLGATDESSGVEKIYYQLNNEKKLAYSKVLPFALIGEYSIEIEAIDRVGNKEIKKVTFAIKDIPEAE